MVMHEAAHESRFIAEALDLTCLAPDRPVVCVQGLGFVGAAMAAAIAEARNDDGGPRFTVIGVDLATKSGRERAAAIDSGRFPFGCPDPMLAQALEQAHGAGNLAARVDPGPSRWPTSRSSMFSSTSALSQAGAAPVSSHSLPRSARWASRCGPAR